MMIAVMVAAHWTGKPPANRTDPFVATTPAKEVQIHFALAHTHPPMRCAGICAGAVSASERNFVVHVAGDRCGHHRQVGLGRLSDTLECGRLDPTDTLVPVLKPADAKLDDRINVWLCPLHAAACL